MQRIRLVVSDVDGTLLDSGRALPQSARNAVTALHRAGIAFTIVSARPPAGEKALIADLSLTLPIGSFNGAVLATPELRVLERHLIGDGAQVAFDLLRAEGVSIWVYTAHHWFVESLNGAHVEEESAIGHVHPRVTSDLVSLLPESVKVVGVCDEEAERDWLLRRLEHRLRPQCAVGQSKNRYVEIMSATANKGRIVAHLCRELGLVKDEVAAIGDGWNDRAMFRHAGLSIAMGSAPELVRQAANHVTGTADGDNFAQAVEKWVLQRSAA